MENYILFPTNQSTTMNRKKNISVHMVAKMIESSHIFELSSSENHFFFFLPQSNYANVYIKCPFKVLILNELGCCGFFFGKSVSDCFIQMRMQSAREQIVATVSTHDDNTSIWVILTFLYLYFVFHVLVLFKTLIIKFRWNFLAQLNLTRSYTDDILLAILPTHFFPINI